MILNPTQVKTADHKPNVSLPNALLRVEALALLIGGILMFARTGGAWWVFLVFLFVPDLSAIPYVINLRVGAISYNLVHTYTIPCVILIAALSSENTVFIQIAAIWLAHIGMDRAIGYGLKYASGFKDTHMQRV